MAIITTAGGANSNSYISVSEADSRFYSSFYNATWSVFDTDTKENWLVQATRAIELLRFKGARWNGATQALSFPRVNVETAYYNRYSYPSVSEIYGYFVEDDYQTPVGVVPEPVKEAQTVMIMVLQLNQGDSGEIEPKEINSLELLDTTIKLEYRENSRSDELRVISGTTIQTVERLLRPWLVPINTIPIMW